MKELSKIFNPEEIEELEIFKDGTEAMIVNEKEVICFNLMYDLIKENKSISEISKDKLLVAYAQLKSFKETSKSIGIFDTRLLENIVEKSKKLIWEEIKKRA
ncbi:MAG TPA: hypothetical protein PK566_10290 [Pseudobacteroides sp.]|nr:hypothetical protein [Pseudobacteroides sp.]